MAFYLKHRVYFKYQIGCRCCLYILETLLCTEFLLAWLGWWKLFQFDVSELSYLNKVTCFKKVIKIIFKIKHMYTRWFYSHLLSLFAISSDAAAYIRGKRQIQRGGQAIEQIRGQRTPMSPPSLLLTCPSHYKYPRKVDIKISLIVSKFSIDIQ